jgi:hypothetical protein
MQARLSISSEDQKLLKHAKGRRLAVVWWGRGFGLAGVVCDGVVGASACGGVVEARLRLGVVCGGVMGGFGLRWCGGRGFGLMWWAVVWWKASTCGGVVGARLRLGVVGGVVRASASGI